MISRFRRRSRARQFTFSLLILWIAFCPITVSGDEEKPMYSPEGCKTPDAPTCPTAGTFHTWSPEFFRKCRDQLENYDIKIEKHPFEPEKVCIVFLSLAKGSKVCADVGNYADSIVGGIVAFLVLIVFDVVGVGLIIYSCIRPNAHPTPPPPPPSTQPSQPTVVIVQTGAAAVNTPKDEEKGPE